jgi:NADPH:quinone reductase-like Zn-dependent oxidoreductase
MGATSYVLFAGLAVAIGYGLHLNQSLDGAAVVGKPMMHAIHHAKYGEPADVLEMIDAPVPSYRSWEVLVEVQAASINPVDYKIIQGAFFIIDFLLTRRPGFDFSGKVLAVGKDCTSIKVGDTVHGMTWVHKTGSLAEYLAIDESAINVIPDAITAQEAAALPLVAHTSYSSLVTMGGLRKGSNQRVLVLGGSSATGMMALQLAKAYGAAHIASTCSPRNDELVKSLGADETVNYREDDVFDVMRKAGKSFDIIYDTVGAGVSVWEGAAGTPIGDHHTDTAGVLAPGGQLVTITGDIQRTLDITDLLTRGACPYQCLHNAPRSTRPHSSPHLLLTTPPPHHTSSSPHLLLTTPPPPRHTSSSPHLLLLATPPRDVHSPLCSSLLLSAPLCSISPLGYQIVTRKLHCLFMLGGGGYHQVQ